MKPGRARIISPDIYRRQDYSMARYHHKARFSVLTVFLVLLLAGAGLLTGCGKKGPLYMPGQQQQQQK